MDRRHALKLFGAVTLASSQSVPSLAGDPMGRGELQYIGDVDRLVLKPGDRVVLSCDGMISRDQAERLRKEMESALGGQHKVIVLGNGLKLGALGSA